MTRLVVDQENSVRVAGAGPNDEEPKMENKALDIATRVLAGEPVSEEEMAYANKRSAKYQLVRYLVMEHSTYGDGPQMTSFHFTPGTKFDDMSVIEIAHAIVSTDLSDAKPLDFNDLRWKE